MEGRMANPLNFSISDYPHLAKLINGQEVTLRVKARVGAKILGGQGEYISFSPDSIDYEEDRRPSVQEVMMASLLSIDQSLGKTNNPIP
jgi:hypothetical protein